MERKFNQLKKIKEENTSLLLSFERLIHLQFLFKVVVWSEILMIVLCQIPILKLWMNAENIFPISFVKVTIQQKKSATYTLITRRQFTRVFLTFLPLTRQNSSFLRFVIFKVWRFLDYSSRSLVWGFCWNLLWFS